MQSDFAVDGNNYAMTGTLKHLASGQLVDAWGAGNFMALKFTVPEGATSVKVGMEPSYGGGLVEIINDPDKNGAFKVTDKDEQVFKVVTTVDGETVTKTYDLSDLVCLEEISEEIGQGGSMDEDLDG